MQEVQSCLRSWTNVSRPAAFFPNLGTERRRERVFCAQVAVQIRTALLIIFFLLHSYPQPTDGSGRGLFIAPFSPSPSTSACRLKEINYTACRHFAAGVTISDGASQQAVMCAEKVVRSDFVAG